MQVSVNAVRQDRLFARFSEEELGRVLAESAAKSAGFHIDADTQIRSYIRHEDRVGSAGVAVYAEVTAVNDHGDAPEVGK